MTCSADARAQEQRPDSSADDTLGPLLVAAAGGCSASFATLYERTHRRVFGIVMRIVRHRAEAEEVLQEIYVKVWSRSLQFDPSGGRVIHWLAGIAQRASIDAVRRASSRPREVNGALDDATPYDDVPSTDDGPADALARTQSQRLVRARLRALPVEQRESLLLTFFDGLTQPEIAARLACPLGTIKSRVRRALMALRPALQAAQ